MSAAWGNNYRVTIYGESHGNGVGVLIDGLPAGVPFPKDRIEKELYRRKPGRGDYTTGRKEEDSFVILSGVFQGYTTGGAVNLFVKNKDTRSRDYSNIKDKMRPGHADFAGFSKYFGYNDYRGGGHFSGRLTAGIVIAGAIARELLERMDIYIGAHILSIKDVEDKKFDSINIQKEELAALSCINEQFPVLDESVRGKMKDAILNAKSSMDSVGGEIEVAVVGLNPGVGNPFFHSVESKISSMMFSIPGIKGIQFGEGFDITKMLGSQSNDSPQIIEGKIVHEKNNNGGITGGITNGMPVVFRVGVKPTPSIGRYQNTIDVGRMENTELKIDGRHDPCIVPRGVPVVECACAIAIFDLMLERIKENEGFAMFKKRDR